MEVKMIPKLGKQVRKYARYGLVIVSVLLVAAMLANSGLADALHLIPLPQKGEPPQKAQEPLTDVAPPQPAVDVKAEENPQARLKALGLDTLPAVDKGLLPSDVMDLANPPQWTETIAASSDNPVPPDPFKTPVMAVNPERGQPEDAPLPWAVQPQSDQSKESK
jgi:hypothetical protein